MKCPKCGNENNEGVKFCGSCGANINGEVYSNNKKDVKNMFNYYLHFIINAFLNPFKTYKEEKEYYTDNKNVFILSGVVSVLMMLVVLLESMISVCFTKNLWTGETTFDISNLKYLNYFSLTLKNLLIFALVIYAVAGVYYLASLIIKKNANYMRLLVISCISILPIIAAIILIPILSLIWSLLIAIVLIAAIVYSIKIFNGLEKEEIKFDDIQKETYFNLACITFIMSVIIYIAYSSASSLLSSFLF